MKSSLMASFALLCVLFTTNKVVAQDYSFLSECVREQGLERIDPIDKIEVIAEVEGYILVDLYPANNHEFKWPAVAKLQPKCDFVWANPNNDLMPMANIELPKNIAQALVDQSFQTRIKELGGKEALFASFNSKVDDDGILWIPPEEYEGLKKLGFQTKYKVKTSLEYPSF